MDLQQLQKLFESQRELDQEIATKHNITYESVWNELLMAFLVEIGECANETRCFKFWSLKGPSENDVILEEYVDGVHFLLSIGLHYGFDQMDELASRTKSLMKIDLTEIFHNIYRIATLLQIERKPVHYYSLFEYYFALGHALSFSDEEIIGAYYAKHEENYRRQENGY